MKSKSYKAVLYKLAIYIEMQQTQNSHNKLEGEKIGRLTLLNFMTCFKAVVIKRV